MVEEYWWRKCSTVSGMDIGKRGNPSHHSVFAITDDNTRLDENNIPTEVLIQLHSKFMDGWDFTKQVEYLKSCVDYFGIQRGYLDNTNLVMDERDLPREIIPIILSSHDGPKAKGKVKLATQVAKLVEQKRIRLLDDDRFISQITCVDNSLQAPNTPSGHGDSFISVILAVGVYYDFFAKDRKKGFSNLGDAQELLVKQNPNLRSPSLPDNICKVCGNRTFDQTPEGRKLCRKCLTLW